jgi:hypothetical protein
LGGYLRDFLERRDGNDTLHGANGNRHFSGDDDSLYEGSGIDIADFRSAPGPVDVSLNTAIRMGDGLCEPDDLWTPSDFRPSAFTNGACTE